MDTVYDIRNLVKYYPGQKRPANENINLTIYEGEIFGMLGDNGSGKTTLVRQMVNVLQSTAGSITLWKRPLQQDPLLVPRNVGYMPQSTLALTTLKAGAVLYYTAHLRGMTYSDARRERDRLLALWHIDSIAGQRIRNLSGGQQRLLQLAIAMAASPPVLILDEPTNDLSPQRRRLVWDVLRELNARQGTTIIFITHNALEAEKVIQRIGIMQAGKLDPIGRLHELKKQIDQRLRLELFFSSRLSPTLSVDGAAIDKANSGHWIIHLSQDQVTDALQQIKAQGNMIDDFRLHSATLEDLYLHYAGQNKKP